MAIVYRTDGAWGTGQGSNLSAAQVDENFYGIDQRVVTIESGVAAAVNNIASVSVVGSQMLITMEDATTFGPFTLPIATFHWTGEWAVDTDYAELDLFYVTGDGLYMVLLDHTSDPVSFDPGAVDEENNPLYFKLVGEITSLLLFGDFPNSYEAQRGYQLTINASEDAVEFIPREHLFRLWHPGTYIADQLLFREVVTERTIMPESVPLIQAWADAPTDAVFLSLQRNGVEFGTLTFDGGVENSVSVFMAGGDEIFEPGDYFEIFAPSGTPDATIANIAVTFPCYRRPELITT